RSRRQHSRAETASGISTRVPSGGNRSMIRHARPPWAGAVPAILAGWLLVGGSILAHAADPTAEELAELSLEQLINVEVTSVSRRAERLSDAAASIFVINAEDIRRSGATTLPEALRLAPNLAVARADANQYAIAARAFNGTVANKMLVMID